MPSLENWDGGLKIFCGWSQLSPHIQVSLTHTHLHAYRQKHKQPQGLENIHKNFMYGYLFIDESVGAGVKVSSEVFIPDRHTCAQ